MKLGSNLVQKVRVSYNVGKRILRQPVLLQYLGKIAIKHVKHNLV